MASRPIVLITGANTGLGFQIVRAIAKSKHPYHIILAGRSPDKVDQAIQNIKAEAPSSASTFGPLQVDIESDESIEHAFEKVKAQHNRIDVLINNAGAQLDPQYAEGKLSMREMWNRSWNVNTAGTQVMTSVFVPLLLQSSNPRLLFITSGTSTLQGADNLALPVNKSPPKGWPKASLAIPAYRSSKTGMNMMMREWHRLLREDGVKVWCISPGYLATGLGGSQEANKSAGAGDPAVGGQFVCDVVEGARDADVGKAILRDGVQPW